ncbi:MAG: hypothetical protein ACP5OX_00525 [Minisyncoccia bacterium]
MVKIEEIKLEIIKDSRNENTLQATIKSGNFTATSSIPKGKSRGEKEVFLAPIDKVLLNFEKIKFQILNHSFSSLFDFDKFLINLDGTLNKQNLGGNLTLVLSQAFAKLLAQLKQKELWQILEEEFFILNPSLEQNLSKNKKAPYFFFNILNGGQHAPYGPYIQEYLIIPLTNNPYQSLVTATEFFQNLKIYITQRYAQCQTGDEGGALLPENDYEQPLKIFEQIKNEMKNKNRLEIDIAFGLDIAASSFYRPEEKNYHLAPGLSLTNSELLEIYQYLSDFYHLFSIEDPFEENDFESFGELNKKIGERTLIIGDDLTVTNKEILHKAIEKNSLGAVIIKPTQIGTITETLETIGLAQRKGIKTIISHRSAETMDDFIADLAVATKAFGLKAGAPQTPERVVKYKRVIQIFKLY